MPRPVGADYANVTAVPSSTTAAELLGPNPNRLGVSIFNDSTATLYVKCGIAASTSSYTVQILTLAYWETPFNYTGPLDGLWAAANGNARVTEYLPSQLP